MGHASSFSISFLGLSRVVAAGLAATLLAGMLAFTPSVRAGADVPADVQALADSILDAPTLHEAIAPTREVLTRSGIGIMAPDGSMIVPPAAPASDASVFDQDAIDLALEARFPYGTHGMSLPDAARFMKGFKAPFPKGQKPALAMRAMIAAWVAGAEAMPGEPVSFNALFLQAMASRHGIDLSQATYDPATLRFTSLELQVLTAGLIRDIQIAPHSATPSASAISSVASRGSVPGLSGCTGLGAELEKINPLLGMAVGFAQGMISEGGQDAVSALISYGADSDTKELTGKVVGKLGKAVEIFLRVAKLAQYYGSVYIRTDPLAGLPVVHKSHDGTELKPHVAAIAGLDPAAAAQLEAEKTGASTVQGMMADCWRAWGFPALPTTADLAEGLSKWGVAWKVTPESQLGEYKIDFAGTPWMVMNYRKTPLVPESDGTSARSWIGLKVRPEDPVAPEGELFDLDIPIQASLDASGMPDFPVVTELMKSTLKGAKVHRFGSLNPKNWRVSFLLEATDPLVYLDSIASLSAEMFKGLVQPMVATTQKLQMHIDCSAPLRPGILRAQIRAAGVCQQPTGWSGTLTWSLDSWENEPYYSSTEHQEGTLHAVLKNDSGIVRYPTSMSGQSDYAFSITGSYESASSDPLCSSTGHGDWSYGGSGPLYPFNSEQPAELGVWGLTGGSRLELVVDAYGPGTLHEWGNDSCSGPWDETNDYSQVLSVTGQTNDIDHAACFPTGVDPDGEMLIDHLGSSLIGRWNSATQTWEFSCTRTTSEVNTLYPDRTFGYTTTINGDLQPTYAP